MAVLAKGLDYSSARPDPACVKRKGYSFVMRYVWTSYSPGSADYPGKMLTKAEADKLKGAGIRIVSNFERRARRPLDGRSAGVTDARVAVENTVNAGGPSNAVIYFSVDFDATSTELRGPVADYFRGVISVIGINRVGAYGGYRTIRSLANQGLATWLWQTYAWSDGNWDPRANIRQVRNGVRVCGGDTDINEQHTESIGAWGEAATTARIFEDLDLTWSE